MATIQPPTVQIPPSEETILQLKLLTTIKNDFKAYTAKSPFKTMPQLFEAMFEEYKENRPV